MRKSNLITAALVITCTFLSGCGSQDHFEDLSDYMTKLKDTRMIKKIPVKNLEITIPTPASYEAASLREPFSLISSEENNPTSKASEPLLKYAVTMLRFVGTLIDDGKTTAFVLTPDNMMYQVRVGDVIGDQYGKILAISETEMKIEQLNTDDTTGSNIVTLQLKDE